MSSYPPWPAAASELILWAEVISVWILAVYALAPSAARAEANPASASRATWRLLTASVLSTLATGLLPPPGTASSERVALCGLVLVLVVSTSVGRRRLTRSPRGRRFIAEWELGALAALVLLSALLIGSAELAKRPPLAIVQSGKVAAVLSVLAALVFATRGGTYVVRGVLDKTNALPVAAADPVANPGTKTLDVTEFNRGRSIGNLERLLMVMVVGLGHYEALGFLIAAKGLIRAREFEDRNFAEYFILGSLTSAAVALAVGTVVRVSVPLLWGLPP